MMGKYDWETIEAVFNLGGFAVNAVLDDSAAFLALLGLTSMQIEMLWQNYDDFDYVETAIDDAIARIMMGSSGGGDMIKIADNVAIEDVASLTIDNFDSGTFCTYKLIIQGLKTDYTGNWVDNVKMTINGVTTPDGYNSFGFASWLSGYGKIEKIGNYAGMYLLYAAASDQVSGQAIADLELMFFDPQGDDYKRCSYLGQTFGFIAVKQLITRGVCVYESGAVISSIKIEPDLGTTFLVDPATTGNPSELRMTLYGLQ